MNMRTRPLVAGKERETLEILEEALRGTAYRAWTKIRLQDVLEPDCRENVSPADRNFLMTAHIDFVVSERHGDRRPVFAVEFDGPQHQVEPYRGRDIRKNRMCAAAKLPLLRIGYAELEDFERLTIFEFMLQRFVAWQREHRAIGDWIGQTAAGLSPSELERTAEDGVSLDPAFWFNLKHKFPGIPAVAKRLLARFRIVTPFLQSETPSKLGLGERYLRCEVMLSGASYGSAGSATEIVKHIGYSVYRHDLKLTKLRWVGERIETPGVEVLFAGRLTFRMQWARQVAADYDPEEAPIDYLARTGEMPIAFLDVPGVHVPDIAEWMGEYLALREVERWASENLTGVLDKAK